jgi:glycosyltransferase involved in cell wall biosynthesis
VSFAEHTDKGKAARMQENLELLSGRYPDYNKMVADFIALDVGRSEREFLQRLVAVRQEEAREGILFINHCCGGGTKVYQDRLIQSWRTEKRLYGIELQSDAKTLAFTDYSQDEEKVFYFDLTQLSEAQFRRCLEAFQINLIYINQLVTYPLKTMMQYISASRIDYVFFVHDFYAVCPTYTLLNEAGVYCREQQEPDLCNRCLRQVGCELTEDIREWRALFQEFLLGAKAVLAPSQSTADSIRKYYPDLTVCVQEHEVGSYVYPTFDAQTLEDEYLTIAVLGAISEIKGAAIIYELVEKIRAAKLPVRIKVIGITHLHNAYYQSEDGVLEITGVYDNRDVSSLLAQYRVSAVLIASVCPETYSYTTSEAIASGYPVLAFDLGAPAERIRRQDCGWVVEEISSDALLAFLADLAANRGRLKEKAKQL